jgi:hypothetical protein
MWFIDCLLDSLAWTYHEWLVDRVCSRVGLIILSIIVIAVILIIIYF